MKQLLKIDTSPRGADSYSRGLAEVCEKLWLEKNQNAKVIHRDLSEGSISHVTQEYSRI